MQCVLAVVRAGKREESYSTMDERATVLLSATAALATGMAFVAGYSVLTADPASARKKKKKKKQKKTQPPTNGGAIS